MRSMQAEPGRESGLKFMWRALTHKNFRLFFVGQGISLIGTWMTRVATSWLVFKLSEPSMAAFVLGAVGFAGQIPTFLMAPVAGVLVDRSNRHQLVVITQILSMIQSFSLAWVVSVGNANDRVIWAIVFLNVFQGLVNAFDMPARQAFLTEMVTRKEDLANAIALNSSLVNSARLLGPSIAGVLIALVGEVWCFLIDGFSYMAVIAALLAMTVAPREIQAHQKRIWHSLKEGLAYAFGFPPIRAILIQLALVSLMGMSYTVLMPIFADQIRTNSPSVLGLLMAASGVGALIGALYLAARNTVLGLGRVIVVATILFGAALLGFANSRILWISMVLMLVSGFGMMVQMAACNTVLQTIVQEDKRGRVMSLYTMAFMGMTPFGSLLAGGLASLLGAPAAVMVGGTACILGGLWFAARLRELRVLIRPIYARMGILPELAAGIDAATRLSVPAEE
ncbi:MAG TPA: MFS transporter [Gemmataceae bacterium]|nr:MFS transporter [Gemmataceae bacterium]